MNEIIAGATQLIGQTDAGGADQMMMRYADAIAAARAALAKAARLEAEVERSRHTLMVETERLRNENDRIAAEHESSVEIRDTEIARLQTDLESSREEMAAQVEAAYREGQSDFRHGSGITSIDWRNSVSRKQLEAK